MGEEPQDGQSHSLYISWQMHNCNPHNRQTTWLWSSWIKVWKSWRETSNRSLSVINALSHNIRHEKFQILTVRISSFKSLITFPHVTYKKIKPTHTHPHPNTDTDKHKGLYIASICIQLLKVWVIRIIHFSFKIFYFYQL